MPEEGKLALDLIDGMPDFIRNTRKLKDHLDQNNTDFPSPTHCLCFNPDEVDTSVEWWKNTFPDKEEMIICAGIGEHEAGRNVDDDWEIMKAWFEVDSGKRTHRPRWFNPKFQRAFMIQSRRDKDVDQEEAPDNLIIPS